MKTLDRKSMFGIFAAVAAVMVGAMPPAADAAGGRADYRACANFGPLYATNR